MGLRNAPKMNGIPSPRTEIDTNVISVYSITSNAVVFAAIKTVGTNVRHPEHRERWK